MNAGYMTIHVYLHLSCFSKKPKGIEWKFYGQAIYWHLRENYNEDTFCVAAIYYIKWQPVPDWDGTRDEAILIIYGSFLAKLCM